jgi:hypothetical protein
MDALHVLDEIKYYLNKLKTSGGLALLDRLHMRVTMNG